MKREVELGPSTYTASPLTILLHSKADRILRTIRAKEIAEEYTDDPDERMRVYLRVLQDPLPVVERTKEEIEIMERIDRDEEVSEEDRAKVQQDPFMLLRIQVMLEVAIRDNHPDTPPSVIRKDIQDYLTPATMNQFNALIEELMALPEMGPEGKKSPDPSEDADKPEKTSPGEA